MKKNHSFLLILAILIISACGNAKILTYQIQNNTNSDLNLNFENFPTDLNTNLSKDTIISLAQGKSIIVGYSVVPDTIKVADWFELYPSWNNFKAIQHGDLTIVESKDADWKLNKKISNLIINPEFVEW
ncbi:MAG: hypothetical protein HRT71_06075 [Flavobacteriales bacterium]|nr:hypothetical protein [Flavobacteriales bacterium]